MEDDDRRMVVITDPHIALDRYYKVYKEGREDIRTFVDNPENNRDFVGWCWPGNSVWTDFYNKHARDYW